MSATTASYILNGRSAEMRISPETQARVRQAADQLRYRPNASARSLRTARSLTVGVISDLVAGGQFASQMLTGASAAARMLDHLVVIGESKGDPTLEGLLIEEMLDRGVDGIVYATMVTSDVRVPDGLRGQRAVLLNCFDRHSSLQSVVPDEYEGGRSAASELLAAGHDDGIHVVGERPTAGAIAGGLRLDGIRDQLRAAGTDVAGVVECAWAVRPAYDAMSAFLDAGKVPAALVCLNDRAAMGTYQALEAHGLRVPQDVSVVSFDGSDLAQWLRPQLTSVVLPYSELGARAVELLLAPGEAVAGVARVPMPIARGGSVRRVAAKR